MPFISVIPLPMGYGNNMPKNITYYLDLSQDMIAADKERDLANLAYDAMDHNDWEVPTNLRQIQWIRPNVDTGPSTDIAAGLRVLSAFKENITIQPLSQNSKKKVNEWERTLEWIMAQV